jgi:hypothetical protein
MLSSAFVALALSASAFANVFVTNPTASTTFNGGKSATVSWQDDGKQPTLQAFGPAIVSIYAGNSQQQTLLQTVSPSVDVSTTQSVVFTPDATIGPNGNEYFIRIQSISLKDATQTQYPALAFSAKFTMAGMTGTFNATVQSQIDGQSTAPIGGTAAPSSSSAAASPSVMSSSSKASSSGSASTSASKTAAAAASTNGAEKLARATVLTVAGVAAVVLGSAFC